MSITPWRLPLLGFPSSALFTISSDCIFCLYQHCYPLLPPTALTLKRYKFNWSNPTAHWSLHLDDKTQRAIMMQIIAINNYESEFSKISSGRGDTSQQVCIWFIFSAGSAHSLSLKATVCDDRGVSHNGDFV
jgi:hypothetical protein